MKKALFKIPSQPAWHSDPVLKPDFNVLSSRVMLVPAQTFDVQKVLLAYQHHAVDNHDIASIEIVYNPDLETLFQSHRRILNTRLGNKKYEPTWVKNCYGNELAFRQEVLTHCRELSLPYADSTCPNVGLLPLWHGTSDVVAGHIFNGGYGIFTSNEPDVVTDEGFFGKGIYGAHEAEYSFRVYATPHGGQAVLLLNWVSFFQAYPVIHGDMEKLRGNRGGYAQCDTHFAPVRSDDHPDTSLYYPCAQGQRHQYIEVVAFNEAQCLPRYRVKLQKRQINAPLAIPSWDIHKMALEELTQYYYERVQSGFEKAAGMGCPLSVVRLHWLTSGASDVMSSSLALAPAFAEHSAKVFQALKQYAEPFALNNAESQFLLGWCYAHGLGVDKDMAEAVKYYWMSAEQGHSDAGYQLGKCCSMGLGIEKNLDQAIQYYQKAAELGHAEANYALSQFYTLGFGVEPVPELATKYRLAAKVAGHPAVVNSFPSGSSQSSGSSTSTTSPEESESSRPLSPTTEKYYEEAVAYERRKAYQEAAGAYQKAAERGHTKARTSLGIFFITGRGGCDKDPQKAYELWKQSAEEGHPRAMLNLANQLKKGIGVSRDEVAARRWEEKAKEIEESGTGMSYKKSA